MKTLSGYFTQNNIRTRRNLRSDIEKRSLVLNEEFLNAFKEVKEVLENLILIKKKSKSKSKIYF